MIIGLTGKAGSGKDTAGEYLVREHGYTRFAYADVLKRAALHVNPLVYDNERLASLVAQHGMDFVKRAHPEARRFLQELGLAMRYVDPSIWLHPLARMAERVERIVVTDVRFDNEAEQVVELNGIVINIERPGVGLAGEAGQHASEAGVSDIWITHTVVNDGTVQDLHDAIRALL